MNKINLTRTQIFCTHVNSWIRSEGYTPKMINDLYDININDVTITFHDIIELEYLNNNNKTSFFWEYALEWLKDSFDNETKISKYALFYILIFILCDNDEYIINKEHKIILYIIRNTLDKYSDSYTINDYFYNIIDQT